MATMLTVEFRDGSTVTAPTEAFLDPDRWRCLIIFLFAADPGSRPLDEHLAWMSSHILRGWVAGEEVEPGTRIVAAEELIERMREEAS